MTSRVLRLHYGRGAAQVAVAAPRLRLVTVPPRSVVLEGAAAISPLVLAALLPMSILMMSAVARQETDRPAASAVVRVEYPAPAEEPALAPVRPQTATPTPAPTNSAPTPASAPTLAQAQAAPPPAMPDAATIEIDRLELVRTAPAPPAELPARIALEVAAAHVGPDASDLSPARSDAPPLELPQVARVSPSRQRLPAVSLPGPALGTSLAGVNAVASPAPRPGLVAPGSPAVARLPEPSVSGASDASFLAVGASAEGGLAVSGEIVGVPLETLAACRSRQREDSLKQGLILAVAKGAQCTGYGGTYSFLETRNLNAFLMHVARDTQRELGNRCDELMRAQMCVAARHVTGVQ